MEEVSISRDSRSLNRSQQKANYSVLDGATRVRHSIKHIEELQKDNHNEAKIGVQNPSSDEKGKHNPGVRKLLSSRKTLRNYLDEIGSDHYVTAGLPNYSYPARKLCSMCGYWAAYHCYRCGSVYCSLACDSLHKEARCHR